MEHRPLQRLAVLYNKLVSYCLNSTIIKLKCQITIILANRFETYHVTMLNISTALLNSFFRITWTNVFVRGLISGILIFTAMHERQALWKSCFDLVFGVSRGMAPRLQFSDSIELLKVETFIQNRRRSFPRLNSKPQRLRVLRRLILFINSLKQVVTVNGYQDIALLC